MAALIKEVEKVHVEGMQRPLAVRTTGLEDINDDGDLREELNRLFLRDATDMVVEVTGS